MECASACLTGVFSRAHAAPGGRVGDAGSDEPLHARCELVNLCCARALCVLTGALLPAQCFCSLAIGIEIDSLEDANSAFSVAFNSALRNSTQRFFVIPFYKWMPWLFSSEAKLKEAIAALDSLLFGLIESRRNEPRLEERTDLLSRYLLLQQEQKRNGLQPEELPIHDR